MKKNSSRYVPIIQRIVRKSILLSFFMILISLAVQYQAEIEAYLGDTYDYLYLTPLIALILALAFNKSITVGYAIIKNIKSSPTLEVFGYFVYGVATGYMSAVADGWMELLMLQVIIGAIVTIFLNRISYDLKKSPSKVKSILMGDKPVDINLEPVDSQTRQAKILKNLIMSQAKGDSITINIDGRWGDAKSSIVTSVRDELLNQGGYIWVDFESWRYPKEEDLIVNFYNDIGETVDRNIPSLRSEKSSLQTFAKSIVKLAEPTGLLDGIAALITPKPESTMSSIRTKLALYDKRLVVVIDDLDRLLEKNYVYRALQLSHVLKSTDIPGSIVIIPADFEVIAKTLELDKGSLYLQKMSEYTLTTVPPTFEEMKTFLDKRLGSEYKYVFDHTMHRLIRNFRGAIRVVNSYRTIYDTLAGQVDGEDIFMLSVLGHSAPMMISDMKDNLRIYTEDDSMEDMNWFMLDESNKSHVRKRHFESLMSNLDSDFKKEDVKEVTERLFATMKGALREQGIGAQLVSPQQMDLRKRVSSRGNLEAYFYHQRDVLKAAQAEEAARSFIDMYYSLSEGKVRYSYLARYFNMMTIDEMPKFFATVSKLASFDQSSADGDDMKLESTLSLMHDMLAYLIQNSHRIDGADYDLLPKLLYDFDYILVSDLNLAKVFDDLSSYFNKPSTPLSLLFLLSPSHNNSLFNVKKYQGYNLLRKNFLNLIDDYYLEQKHDIFDEDSSSDNHWKFTLSQWGMSVWGDNPNEIVNDRKRRVSYYVTSIIKDDEQKLHRFIIGAYRTTNFSLPDDKPYYDLSPMQPYRILDVAAIVRHALSAKDSSLSKIQRSDLEDFIAAYQRI